MIFKMKHISFLFFLLSGIATVYSQEQRALLIGIDQYVPPAGYTPSTNTGRLDFQNQKKKLTRMKIKISIIRK